MKKVILELPGHRALKVKPDHKGQQVPTVQWDRRVRRARRVRTEQWVYKV